MIKIFSSQTLQLRQAFVLAFKKFLSIDGAVRAAAFAYYVFFSLLPLVTLLAAVGSFFIERKEVTRQIINYVQGFIPLNNDMKFNIFTTIIRAVEDRNQIGIIAFIAVLWAALQLFTELTRAVNQAWGADQYNWWRLPLKNLLLLLIVAGAIVIGISMPLILNLIKEWWFPNFNQVCWAYVFTITIVPFGVLFFGLSLFYSWAPRHKKHFSQVKLATFIATVLLLILEESFSAYVDNFAKFNVVYGALGGIMALLLWFYLSGCILIWGACFSSAQAEIKK